MPNGQKMYLHCLFLGPPKFNHNGIWALKFTIWQPCAFSEFDAARPTIIIGMLVAEFDFLGSVED
jgi:hypothetical protein